MQRPGDCPIILYFRITGLNRFCGYAARKKGEGKFLEFFFFDLFYFHGAITQYLTCGVVYGELLYKSWGIIGDDCMEIVMK